VTKGTWVTTAAGTRYWYGPGYYRDSSTDAKAAKPYEIDGKTYLFSNSGYMQTGIVYYMYSLAGTSAVLHYYDCGTDGVATLLNGIYNDNLYEDGVRQITYKLFTLDGALYFLNGHKIAKSKTLYLSERFVAGKTFPDGRAIPVGNYYFDAEGKMVIPEYKHGIYDDRVYINDVLQKAYQLVEVNGDFYFINENGHKIAKNKTLYLSAKFVEGKTFANGDSIPVGTYYFDAEGKMVIPE
jgi:glucan-binding YG repeat protein